MQPPTNNIKLPQPPRRRYSLGLLLVWLIVLAGMGGAAANHRNIEDWWRLRGYRAPAAVAQLADQDTMTPAARKIFYVNRPAIDDKNSFAPACGAGTVKEQTIVLGCYHGNQNGIYVLSVDDPRLSGVEQVTAAHEMLHAAYDRLSSADRQQVDQQLLDYYHNNLHDQRVLSTIDAYKKTEPNDLVNEMHSIFGTEIAGLPPGLEQYYKRYFTNRQQVAAFAAQYQSAFTSRQAALSQLETRLDSLKQQIQSMEADLKAQKADIDSRQSQLVAERDSGNLAAYNAGVAGYNRSIDEYNSAVDSLRGLVNNFNALVSQHNDLVLEQSQLRDELDANSVPDRR
jgi:Skp family chaperone for outer membrane proteins